ncbi:uncharacterized protein LOC114312878 [Camellia sinensis]|uniref:uncharacterized protein LOC114312878 n=1 Tax=Camellia sinensis TaxID=4442 RepID=UPI001035B365|nr:uncharacterized protein LOC114312878 [Camellia sinensis]
MVMMKLLTWNVRGLGRKEKRSKVKRLLKDRGIDIALFQETKKASMSEKEIKEIWARDSMEYMTVDVEGSAGGLLCIWDPAVFQMSSCCCNKRFVLLSGSLFFSFDCVLINVYAPNEVGQRGKLWECLLKLKEEYSKPWYIGGDFNEIRKIGERKGCSTRDKGMKELNDFVDSSELNDLPLLGRRFTWCNAREGEKWSRIDRVLVDPKWVESFNLKLWGLPRVMSDHSPLLLMEDERESLKRQKNVITCRVKLHMQYKVEEGRG